MPRRHVVAHKKLSQEVYRLLWTSLILSCFIFGVSLKLWGAASLWLNPSGSFLTAFYSVFLIVRLRKQRALAANSPSHIPAIPPTCSQESILCALYLACYFAAGLLVILIMASKIAVHGRSTVPVMLLEGTLVAAEVAILATLALKCTHERKTVGIPGFTRLPGHPKNFATTCPYTSRQAEPDDEILCFDL
ncbi:hypothetical protein BDZ94DRAFT_1311217 [Collybia nuda]|uniref:Transmembrane protein n=1 Tax=Collybia nuda TaxID=64659 RepID=A0A9P6CCJ1_9AGAR|nr:hypothetical protein BDZ94DRAFT_1311217 [Collybia nuda]